MSAKIDSKEVLARFRRLRNVAKRFADHAQQDWAEDDLHDAAMAYAAAWRKIARRGRS